MAVELSLEGQANHAIFMHQVAHMSPDQMRQMLGTVHYSYLAHREYLGQVMRADLGIEAVPIGELD